MLANTERMQVMPGSAQVVRVDEENYSIRLRLSGKPLPGFLEHSMWRESLDYSIPHETYERSRSLGNANGFEYAGSLQAVCHMINNMGFVDAVENRWIRVNYDDHRAQK